MGWPRCSYYLKYRQESLKAINEEGVEIAGAFAWSWINNWEIGTFYHSLGMYVINLTTQERYYRRSIFDYIDYVESRRVGL